MGDGDGNVDGRATTPAARRRAAAIAGHRGEVDDARSLFRDPEPSVRATALGALARSGALTALDLEAALRDSEPAVRRRSLELVAALGGVGAAAEVSILGLLDDAEASVVEVAAWACGERQRPEPGAVGRLAALADRGTGHDDALVREAAVAALGAIGDADGLAAILRATTDKATVRRRAVLALAPFDGPDVTAALEHALEDRDWQVRQAAEDLLT